MNPKVERGWADKSALTNVALSVMQFCVMKRGYYHQQSPFESTIIILLVHLSPEWITEGCIPCMIADRLQLVFRLAQGNVLVVSV